MSESVNKNDAMEELSRLLDEITIGRQPECTDKETTELLAVATLLKKANFEPAPLPQHLLDQTINLVITELAATRPKRPINWLYSGVLGTVATIILVLGLNTMPGWPTEVAMIPPPEKAVESQNIPQGKIVAEQPPVAGQTTTTKTTSTTKPSVDSPISQPVPSNPQLAADTQAKSTSIMTAPSPQVDQSKSSKMTKSLPTPELSPPTPILVPLSLSKRLPDLIISDIKNGIVRQVYGKDTPQEIIITQRVKSEQSNMTLASEEAPVVLEKQLRKSVVLERGTSKAINKITVTVNDQEVTVEGYLSSAELQKLAESLSSPK